MDKMIKINQNEGATDVEMLERLERISGEQVVLTIFMPIRGSLLTVGREVAKITGGVMRSGEPARIAVHSERVYVNIKDTESTDEYGDTVANRDPLFGSKINEYQFFVMGTGDDIAWLIGELGRTFSTLKVPRIEWWYKDGVQTRSRTMYLEPPTTILRPEFYPWIEEGPAEFIRTYLKSDESVLLIAGPPGTGKTQLLRHMISSHDLTAHVIFDDALMNNDGIFQKFLFSEDQLMVIEDADQVLLKREEGNQLMSRFLNVSDGLIKLPNKKIVFTTNLTELHQVDEALMRPGRCFAIMHTRALTAEESRLAAAAAGLPEPLRKEHTIAELFASRELSKVRKVGF